MQIINITMHEPEDGMKTISAVIDGVYWSVPEGHVMYEKLKAALDADNN